MLDGVRTIEKNYSGKGNKWADKRATGKTVRRASLGR